jgi:hypothetical protein
MRPEQSVAGPVNRTPTKSEPLTDRISRVQVKCPAYRSVADIHWEQVRCRQYAQLSRNYHARRSVLIWADAGRYPAHDRVGAKLRGARPRRHIQAKRHTRLTGNAGAAQFEPTDFFPDLAWREYQRSACCLAPGCRTRSRQISINCVMQPVVGAAHLDAYFLSIAPLSKYETRRMSCRNIDLIVAKHGLAGDLRRLPPARV